jgi:hypothetical protein
MEAEQLNDERHVWVVRASNGSHVGPVSTAQIAQARALGKLDDEAAVRHVNAAGWESIGAFLARTGAPPQEQVDATGQIMLPPTPPPQAGHTRRASADDTAPRRAVSPSRLGGLFDFTFVTFFTVRIVGVLYGIVLLLAAGHLLACVYFGLTTISAAIKASQAGAPSGVGIAIGTALVVAGPVGAALAVMAGRVVLEVIVVTFRISETLAEIKARMR